MAELLLASLNITDAKRIDKGLVNEVYLFDANTKIIKINEDRANLECEYKALHLLREKGFNIPSIIEKSEHYIIMEFIQQDTNDKPTRTKLLYDELSKLHSYTSDMFGSETSYCGKINMPPGFNSDYTIWFRENRWKALLDRILASDLSFYSNYCFAMRVYDIINLIFVDKQITPSLLHGDINPMNFIVNSDKVYFIDPVCHYGDPAYDLACYDIWAGTPKTDAVSLLYYSFILLVGYSLTKKQNTINRAKQYMVKLLEMYPKRYLSLLEPVNVSPNYDYIVIMQGCFNPVHLNHVQTPDIATQYIKNRYQTDNVLTVFALAPDERIFSKSRDGIVLYHRKEMLRLALQGRQNTMIDFTGLWVDNIIDHYKNLYPGCKEVYICCGMDGLDWSFKKFNSQQKFLVVQRNGYEKTIVDDRITYLYDETITTMSSSQLRKDAETYKANMHADVYNYFINYLK